MSKQLTGIGLCVVALAGLLVVTGCGNGTGNVGDGNGGTVKADNAACPMMGNKLPEAGVPTAQSRKYKGKTIGFCCPPCAPKWDKLPDAGKDALMAKMFTKAVSTGTGTSSSPTAAVINTKCPIMGGKVNPATVPANLIREFGGKKIGFCCAGCPKKWDNLPDAKKAELLAKLSG